MAQKQTLTHLLCCVVLYCFVKMQNSSRIPNSLNWLTSCAMCHSSCYATAIKNKLIRDPTHLKSTSQKGRMHSREEGRRTAVWLTGVFRMSLMRHWSSALLAADLLQQLLYVWEEEFLNECMLYVCYFMKGEYMHSISGRMIKCTDVGP